MPLSTPPITNTWREFIAFVRRPQLIQPSGVLTPGGPGVLSAMVLFEVAGVSLLAPLMALWQKLTGLSGPDAFSQFPRQYLVLAVVLVAPVLEELIFRGWLIGKARTLWLLACTVLGSFGLWLSYGTPPLFTAILFGTLLTAFAGWFVLLARGVPAWYERHFSQVFWISVIIFGASHLLNFSQAGLATLPLVLPQIWAGLTLGFTRLRVGLGGAIIAHAVSNALVVSFAMT